MVVLKTLAIPALAVLALIGLLVAVAFLWFLLPELRPALRKGASRLATSLRPRSA